MSTSGNVGQATCGSGRNRKNPDNHATVSAVVATETAVNNTNNNSNSISNSSSGRGGSDNNNSSNNSDIPQPAYDLVRNKCIRCLGPGYRWRKCTDCVPPVVSAYGQNNNGN